MALLDKADKGSKRTNTLAYLMRDALTKKKVLQRWYQIQDVLVDDHILV